MRYDQDLGPAKRRNIFNRAARAARMSVRPTTQRLPKRAKKKITEVDAILDGLIFFGSKDTYSCEELGNCVGLTGQRIQQIQDRALEKIAAALGRTPELSFITMNWYTHAHEHHR